MASKWVRKFGAALAVLLVGGGAAYGLLVGKPKPEPQAPPTLQPPLVEVISAAPTARAPFSNIIPAGVR